MVCMIKLREQWVKDGVNLDRIFSLKRKPGERAFRRLDDYHDYLFYMNGQVRDLKTNKFIGGSNVRNGNQIFVTDSYGKKRLILRKQLLLRAWPKPYPLAEVSMGMRIIWFHNQDSTDHRVENLYHTHMVNHRALPEIRKDGWLHHPMKMIDIDTREVFPQFSVDTCAVGIGMDPLDVLSLAVKDAKHQGYIFELDHTKPWSQSFKPKTTHLLELLP